MAPEPPLKLCPVDERFDLLELGWQGRFSELVRAIDRQTGEQSGVYRLRADLTLNDEFAVAFHLAAASSSGLFHPNLLYLREVARDRDDTVYGVTEWPGGRSMEQILQDHGPLHPGALTELAWDISGALAFCARHQLQHGDICPANMIRAENGDVLLVGFQPAIDQGEYDPAPDLHAFCRATYRLATGRWPDVGGLNVEGLPPWLVPVLERGLAEDPALRFANPDELRQVLRRSRDESASRPSGYASGSPSGLAHSDPNGFPWRPLSEHYETFGEPLAGGMGAVWQAREKGTDRVVAVKRLRHDDAGGSARARFHREARSVASLSHPNLIQLLAIGRDHEGDYLVMEWAAGGSLSQMLAREGVLEPAGVLGIARQVLAALQYAHDQGYVHRDIKPANLLIDRRGDIKVADFGLSRGAEDMSLTSSTGGAGTPMYMAPEQWRAKDADARSDIYSVGKTLYHLATGRAPSTLEPHRIPEPLRGALNRALEDAPEDRFPTAAEFLTALEAGMASDRPRPSVTTKVLAATLIVAASCAAWLLWGRLGSEPPVTESPVTESPITESPVAPDLVNPASPVERAARARAALVATIDRWDALRSQPGVDPADPGFAAALQEARSLISAVDRGEDIESRWESEHGALDTALKEQIERVRVAPEKFGRSVLPIVPLQRGARIDAAGVASIVDVRLPEEDQPFQLDHVLGAYLLNDVPAGQPLHWVDVSVYPVAR